MAGGLTVQVRQIASYPSVGIPATGDLLLLQQGGQGGPYGTVNVGTLVANGLANPAGPAMGVGNVPPGNAWAGGVFADQLVVPATGGGILYNCYFDTTGPSTVLRYWQTGTGGGAALLENGDFAWQVAPAGIAGQAVAQGSLSNAMLLTVAGSLQLPLGTLTVARDPAGAFDVATMGWVGRSTVASFNGRRGVVTLNAADIYGALGICPPDRIATQCSVDAAICAAINDALRMHPGVYSWMGRVGDVFLTVGDMNFAAANNPSFLPPLTIPTPPSTVIDGEVVTAAWVLDMLAVWSGGGNPPFATEAWVQNYIATSAVQSFNGRTGAVNLTLADILGAQGAPIASPAFSGVPTVPTAAPGSNTGQIASTAFVQAAISGATAGVASFNGRTGTVTLNSTDVSNAGGALLNSPAFTGLPTAPTPAAGNNSTLLATTAFVTAAVAAAGGVTSFNTRTGAITLTIGDVTGVGGAPINSPAFTGTPTGPTAAAGTNNTELATTAFVNAAITSIGIGVTSFEGRTGAVTLQANDISAAGGLINPSVNLTGVPTAPTAATGNSSTQIATTAFVTAAILAGSVTTFNGRAGAVTLGAADLTGAGGALLASPTFTGTPAAPTAAPGTNTTQLATCAFVTAALTTQAANSVTSFNGRQGVVTLTTADITGAGGAPIASPTFTGTPSVPTATAGTSTTQAASTAFVMAAIAASTAGVVSFNSRTGAVTLQTNDVSAVGGALLASPTFTGTPTAPTPTAGDNSTNIATTAFVAHALSTAAVTSFNGRTGAVTLTVADVNAAGGPYATTAQLAGYLPLTGGILTGALTMPGATINGTGAGALNVPNGGANIGGVMTSATASIQGLCAIGSTIQLNPGSTNSITGVNGINAVSLATTGNITSGTTIGAQGVISTAANMQCNALVVSGGAQLQGPSGTIRWVSGNGTWVASQNQSDPIWQWGSTSALLMSLASSGNLAITGTLSQGSDETTKNTIAAYAPGVSIAAQLSPKTFVYNADPNNVQHLGFIAQDVQQVLPDAVSTTEMGTGTMLGLDLTAIVAVLANAVKQLISRVAALESNASITPSAAETA